MGKRKVNVQEELDGIDNVLTLDSIPDISELPILSIEVNASSEPVVSGPIKFASYI